MNLIRFAASDRVHASDVSGAVGNSGASGSRNPFAWRRVSANIHATRPPARYRPHTLMRAMKDAASQGG
jgi:hypothetical protein